jgi:phytanoyl-CoA hydroxylase
MTAELMFKAESAGQSPTGAPGRAALSDLYSPAAIAEPLRGGWKAVDLTGVAEYERQGFVAVDPVLTPEQVATALAAIEDLATGRDAAFADIYLEPKRDERAPPPAHSLNVRKIFRFVQHEPRLNAIAHDEAVLAIVRRLLGGRTPMLFQDMALLKPPRIGSEKPWHQDHAYFDLALDERVVGVWIALDPATIENGCMQFIAGGHRCGAMEHRAVRDWQIPDAAVRGVRSVVCPLPPGAAVFFDSYVPHGTPPNDSADRRRALQFHYCAAGARPIASAERLRAFGPQTQSDGARAP